MTETNNDGAAATEDLSPAAANSSAAPKAANPIVTNPTVPLTSHQDSGQGKRPRDARLIHLLLSSMGCTAYQERVPLQLLDFAYRHSSSILSDALHLSSDAYISQQTRARDAPVGGHMRDDGQVSANAVQLAIQSRLQYQFGGGNGASGLSKEFLLELAQARNRVALPRVLQNEWGVRLPSERFVLTGVPWGLRGDWVLEEEETSTNNAGPDNNEAMEGVEIKDENIEEGNEEGGTMDDLFGATTDIDVDMDKEE
ncbi:BgTH12-01715 [Blumeria graminis f. sp. triticale]|uniref:Bgt-3201 n=3 Tax=Blumeria graminis TaxID=34373 RepID=A0A061HLT9_BLUGR|nr:Subunit of TFIID and SAGA complexes [Blumeria graminis f. sp. tritici 96224]CAD6501463.1 BgTH12-01715 [Blumeria graminis f. sp. triticale]VDB83968.1 Bgt-3201 [Blumeria graminis f. sp. tritici]